jgi:ArsR family transcriptional regulator
MSSARPQTAPSRLPRAELFRVLSEPVRLQILALCRDTELAVGELATLLEDSQPQMSRKLAPLRELGLLEARKDGTRTWLRTHLEGSEADPVLIEALEEGRHLCLKDGSLAKVPALIAAREETGREFFEAQAPTPQDASSPAMLAPLAALAPLLPGRALAVDVGTGEGMLLDVLSPLFQRVIALDRSRAQLAWAARRVAERGFTNVSLFPGSYDDASLVQRVDAAGGADLVFASRVLHHAARPEDAIASFVRLLKKGGHLVVLDYLPHGDETMRESQGDVWLGFAPRTVASQLAAAGLEVQGEVAIPSALHRDGPDAHLDWHAVVARKPLPAAKLSIPGRS